MSQVPHVPPTLSVLASCCEGVFQPQYNEVIPLASKHVPVTGKPEQSFGFPFFFSDQQGPARFPRDSFLYKEINCNTELQEMKVIALTFQFANEDTAQML